MARAGRVSRCDCGGTRARRQQVCHAQLMLTRQRGYFKYIAQSKLRQRSAAALNASCRCRRWWYRLHHSDARKSVEGRFACEARWLTVPGATLRCCCTLGKWCRRLRAPERRRRGSICAGCKASTESRRGGCGYATRRRRRIERVRCGMPRRRAAGSCVAASRTAIVGRTHSARASARKRRIGCV